MGNLGASINHSLEMETVNARILTAILVNNYSLSELEERLNISMEDLHDCLEEYCESNLEEVSQLLQEDLFFGD